MKILVAEDNAMHAVITHRFLHQLGYWDIMEVANGYEALRCLETHSFDLILTDWVMPRLDGPTLVKHIRSLAQHSQTPIIMVTTNGHVEEAKIAKEAGVDAYIVKPLTFETLKAKIEHVCSQKTQNLVK